MPLSDPLEAAGSAPWLDTFEDALEIPADGLVRLGDTPNNALHGAWLGHPLHPALTDVPLGSWTAAACMDGLDAFSGGNQHAAGAQAAIGVGVLGALGAAVTGLLDWHRHTEGRTRRLGALHGLLNLGATALQAGSWVARRRGDRRLGVSLSSAGFAIALVAAALGGDLVYRRRVGVNRAPTSERTGPAEWIRALPSNLLEESVPQAVQVGDLRIVLVKRFGRLRALAERCSHLGGPLAEGRLEGEGIVCPWHGSCFSLADGHVLRGPSSFRQPHFEVRARRGWIEVRSVLP